MAVKCILTSEAVPGMVLARPVADGSGRTLCGEKTVLTENIIGHLQRGNIANLFIVSDERLPPAEYARARDAIEKRFEKITPGNVLNEVKTALLERLEAKR